VLHCLGIAAATQFQHIRDADLDRVRLERAGELNLEESAFKCALLGNRAALKGPDGRTSKEIIGFADQGFVERIFEADSEFAQANVADAFETIRIQSVATEVTQWI